MRAEVILVALLLTPPVLAQTPAPKPAAPAAPTAPAPAPVDPVLQAATKAFLELAEDDRKAIQDQLVWTGDYNGNVDGDFGRLSFEAIRSWQRKQKSNQSGVLTAAERKALKDAADKAKATAKFAVVTDGIGLRIGVPRTAAPKTAKAGAGTKYHADKDVFVLETLVVPASGATLESMFDSARQTSGDRKVTYRLLRPDFFVVSGDEKGRRFYLRVAKGANGLRGYRLSYPVARAAEFDRLSIAVANSFEPFPGEAAVAAKPDAPKPAPIPPAAPAVPRVSASGLILANGMVLTASAALTDCADPRIGNQPVRVAAKDDGVGLALLEAAGAKGTRWTRGPRADLPPESEALVAAVVGEGDGPAGFASAGVVSTAPGARWRVQAALQAGALGAPIFDRRGALVGIVVEGRKTPFTVAGVVPATAYGAASPASLQLFAKDQNLAFTGAPTLTADPQSAGAVAAAAAPSVVALTCRK
jgi:peptidoglycan hydrolase-like protein with peptidoglycan-binding domain